MQKSKQYSAKDNSSEQKNRANLVEELIQNENNIKELELDISNANLKVQEVNRQLKEYLEKFFRLNPMKYFLFQFFVNLYLKFFSTSFDLLRLI